MTPHPNRTISFLIYCLICAFLFVSNGARMAEIYYTNGHFTERRKLYTFLHSKFHIYNAKHSFCRCHSNHLISISLPTHWSDILNPIKFVLVLLPLPLLLVSRNFGSDFSSRNPNSYPDNQPNNDNPEF